VSRAGPAAGQTCTCGKMCGSGPKLVDGVKRIRWTGTAGLTCAAQVASPRSRTRPGQGGLRGLKLSRPVRCRLAAMSPQFAGMADRKRFRSRKICGSFHLRDVSLPWILRASHTSIRRNCGPCSSSTRVSPARRCPARAPARQAKAAYWHVDEGHDEGRGARQCGPQSLGGYTESAQAWQIDVEVHRRRAT
jgi:hypothetical protein